MFGFLTLLFIGLVLWVAVGLRRANRMIKALETRIALLQIDLRSAKARQEPRPEAVPAPPLTGEPTATEVPTGPPVAPEQPPVAPAQPAAGPAEAPPPPGMGPPQPRRPRLTTIPPIQWERFMGVNLFAWLGGLALFLGVAFFVKYSFEHALISPEVRVAVGFLVGLALLVGGVRMAGKNYAVLSETLCATGVVILYAVTFACRSVYHFQFFGLIPTFLLMALITATAFLLAVRLNALVVAILGMLGGFLTPILLSTGQDNPLGLFGYIALLDVGLLAVALHRRWHFLGLLGAVGTVLMQFAWAATFFAVPKVFTAMGIFLGFDLLFLAAFFWAGFRSQINAWLSAAAILPPFASLAFALYLLSFRDLGQRPGVVFTFVLVADLCLLGLVWMRDKLARLQLAAGITVFSLLGIWTLQHLSPGLLYWSLGLTLLFGIFHSAFPIVLQRLRPGVPAAWWAHLFPPLALLLIMMPIVENSVISLLIWPVVLLINLLAIVLAVLIPSVLSIIGVLLLTLLTMALWILRVPAQVTALPSTLIIIGGFALFFLAAGLLAARKIPAQIPDTQTAPTATPRAGSPAWLGAVMSADLLSQVPTLSATLPFLLLIMLVMRLPLADPSPVFGLALLLSVLILGLARSSEMDWLPAVGLGCVLALEHAWHVRHFQPDYALVPLAWYLGFFAIFWAFPFVLRPPFSSRVIPWAAAALSGPLHFFLVYRLVLAASPNDTMGLLPAAFAVPALLGLTVLLRTLPADSPTRNAQLAWFGGSALFFITLILPIQFERQWITIGWALEGAGLLWLFHRVPHPGLRLTGVALLLVAFGRLALNPAVLSYHPRSATPILNWYLYAYGVVTACLFVGARLLAPPRHLLFGRSVPPFLTGLGTLLAFLLLNIEIADYFSETGATLTFQFAGNFAQDMTYSIAWALFAFALILVGIVKQVSVARYAGLGLLSVTLLKLFFHDLARLSQLYRIGALVGVAIVAILASFLYQRFLARGGRLGEPATSRQASG